jgi:hypothetical protein
MNWQQIATDLQGFLTDIQEAAPLASAAGPEGAAIGALIGGAAKTASTVLTLIENALDPPTGSTLTSIQASVAAIQQANDALSEQVGSS